MQLNDSSLDSIRCIEPLVEAPALKSQMHAICDFFKDNGPFFSLGYGLFFFLIAPIPFTAYILDVLLKLIRAKECGLRICEVQLFLIFFFLH